jgi:hypothetical protein
MAKSVENSCAPFVNGPREGVIVTPATRVPAGLTGIDSFLGVA